MHGLHGIQSISSWAGKQFSLLLSLLIWYCRWGDLCKSWGSSYRLPGPVWWCSRGGGGRRLGRRRRAAGWRRRWAGWRWRYARRELWGSWSWWCLISSLVFRVTVPLAHAAHRVTVLKSWMNATEWLSCAADMLATTLDCWQSCQLATSVAMPMHLATASLLHTCFVWPCVCVSSE